MGAKQCDVCERAADMAIETITGYAASVRYACDEHEMSVRAAALKSGQAPGKSGGSDG